MNNDYETVLATVAYNVKRLRKAKKWSQNVLAYRADIDRTYIGYIENRKFSVSLKKLCALAKALEVDIEELFKSQEIEEILDKTGKNT